MTSKSFSDILLTLKTAFVANQSKVKITDLNSGSIISTIFESIARVIERAYIDTRKGFDSILTAIAYALFGYEQKTGTKASVDLVFSRSSTGSTDITIPKGTIVSDGTYNFITSVKGTIEAGNLDSGSISATAEEVGTDYNLNEDTITIIESVVSAEIVSVTNPEASSGGVDVESDADCQARFKKYINGLQGNNVYGLKAGILAIDGIESVSIEEHFPLKNNIYGFTVYADDGTGNLTDSAIEEIKDVIDGDGTSSNPGLRAAGVMYDVSAATVVPIAISVSCKTYRTEDATAEEDIKEALKEVINDLGINNDVIWSDIILKLRRISYITDVRDLLINGGGENITIDINQVARYSSLDLTIESES